MTPIPQEPKVVILVRPNEGVKAVATNVSLDIKVEVTDSVERFIQAAKGQPYSFIPQN
jgi:hypothetical protein